MKAHNYLDITDGIAHLFAFKKFTIFLDALIHIKKNKPHQLNEVINMLKQADLINDFVVENIYNTHPKVIELRNELNF